MTKTRGRYAIDGRRIAVSDLLDAGLLTAGDSLTFDRPRLEETYTARITDRGWIDIGDGREYQAPSRAAAEVAGLEAIDGWSAWTHGESNQTLFDLRLELLDGDRGEEHQALHERLRSIEPGAEVVVRELLAWWGARGRGRNIVRTVKADLANHDLVSVPDFEKVNLDSTIALHRRSPIDPDTDANLDLAGDLDEDDDHELGLSLGNLPNALDPPVTINPNHELSVAITHMTLNDYWQLPVVDSAGELHGAVTWQSIAHASLKGKKMFARNACVDAPALRFDVELVDALPQLISAGFIVIRGLHNEVAGIVTVADVVDAYGDLASPFVLVGEIDHLLRRILRTQMSEAELIEAVSSETRNVRSFDDLTFSDYRNLLGRTDVWNGLDTMLNRKVFGVRLDEVRLMRNSLAHFEPDPLDAGQLEQVRLFLDTVRNLATEAGA